MGVFCSILYKSCIGYCCSLLYKFVDGLWEYIEFVLMKNLHIFAEITME